VSRGRLVVHAHFYQPFRRDPFSGRIPPDPAAAPFRDWNTRITAECYRANAELGNLRHISWNLGPTLASWMATEEPATLALVAEADRTAPGDPAIAQAYHHSILPLAAARDRRTEIRWGLRDFELRFGRRPGPMWLPETAVDLSTLRALRAEGITATILAPWQVEGSVPDARTPYRVDLGGGESLIVVIYDGELSGAVSFEPNVTADADRFARERVAPRLAAPVPGGGTPLLVIATDGELYGHHQPFRDHFLRRLVAPGAGTPDRGFDVVDLATALDGIEPHALPAVAVRDRTSWSCHHGVLRWTAECPDVPDGRWKGPLRMALDRLAGALDTVTDAGSAALPGMGDPWAARDDYVDVVAGATEPEAFAAPRLARSATPADRQRLLELMEAQRWRLAMFASDGWFWDDPSRTETKQVMRAAARAVRLALGTGSGADRRLVEDLAVLTSPALGIDGAGIYRQALAEIDQPPPG
jgi:hypothetical protein